MISSLIRGPAHGGLGHQRELPEPGELDFGGQDTTRYQLASRVLEIIEHHEWARLRGFPPLRAAAVDDEALVFVPSPDSSSDPPRAHRDSRGDGGNPASGNPEPLAASHDPDVRLTRPVPHRPAPSVSELARSAGELNHCLGAPWARSEWKLRWLR